MNRWQAIAKDRGGSYWQQVQQHLWAMVIFCICFSAGVLAASRLSVCR